MVLFADSGDGSEAEPAMEEENKKIEEHIDASLTPDFREKKIATTCYRKEPTSCQSVSALQELQ